VHAAVRLFIFGSSNTRLDFRQGRSYFLTHASCLGEALGPDPQGVTALLARWNAGDQSARDALVPLVYDELRRIARKYLANQRRGHTLQPTALVHEAYLRLAGRDSSAFRDRVHFFALASQVMRQVLIDHARKAAAAKRGNNPITVALDESLSREQGGRDPRSVDLIALDQAMKQLAVLDARQSKIVELRFFGGLSIEETAQAVSVSQATAKREWMTARVWLHRTMSQSASS